MFFPPFAEELNKSRRMISLQAKKLAAMGFGVLVVDYFGTGDSEGDFGDASWDIWKKDIELITAWLEQQGVKRVTLWGLRLGALIAMDSIALLRNKLGNKLNRILLWQPVLRGDQMMTQFLRLRLAADMIGAGDKTTVRDLRSQLVDGKNVEVAGYELSPALVAGIDSLQLLDMGLSDSPPIEWFEIVGSKEQTLNPASQKVRAAWSDSGIQVNAHKVVGESFWVTPEISVLPGLLERTSDVFQENDFGG